MDQSAQLSIYHHPEYFRWYAGSMPQVLCDERILQGSLTSKRERSADHRKVEAYRAKCYRASRMLRAVHRSMLEMSIPVTNRHNHDQTALETHATYCLSIPSRWSNLGELSRSRDAGVDTMRYTRLTIGRPLKTLTQGIPYEGWLLNPSQADTILSCCEPTRI